MYNSIIKKPRYRNNAFTDDASMLGGDAQQTDED